jgi:hypothetical protein
MRLRMKSWNRAITVATVVASSIAIAAVGGAVADSSDDGPQRSDVATGPVTGDIPETVASGAEVRVADVRNEVSVLRSAARESAAIPDVIAEGPLMTDDAVAEEQARRVRGTEQAWIAPSANGEAVCVVGQGELACHTAEALGGRGAAVGFFKHAHTPWRTTGVATDDVTSVTVVLPDGQEVTTSVQLNYFSIESDAVPVEVRWDGASGPEVESGPDLSSP